MEHEMRPFEKMEGLQRKKWFLFKKGIQNSTKDKRRKAKKADESKEIEGPTSRNNLLEDLLRGRTSDKMDRFELSNRLDPPCVVKRHWSAGAWTSQFGIQTLIERENKITNLLLVFKKK